MPEETVLVVGLGEIGRALFEVLKEKDSFTAYGLDIDPTKMEATKQNANRIPKKMDTIHICLPCKEQSIFISAVADYAARYKPKLLIINSTVPPGTTKKAQDYCKCLLAHSPMRGVHKSPEHMKWELKRWTKYVGGTDQQATAAASKHFIKAGLKVKTLKSCRETELAKLFETTYRALMIAFFQEMHRIARCAGADFDDIVDFLEDTHHVRLDRPIMFPGFIGGHCLIPNVELLLQVYDSDFLKLILSSNEKRKEEMENKAIREEAEKIAARVEKYEKETQRKCEDSN